MRIRTDPVHYSKKVISRYLKKFLDERREVLRSCDAEPVHRMRVASRRLRAALRVFKGLLPARRAGVWNKKISRIGRALGRCRELDVQIIFLKKDGRAGSLIKVLKKERRRALKKIYGKLKDFETRKDLPGLAPWLRSSSGEGGCLAEAFGCQKKKTILKRVDKLLGFSAYIYKPGSVKNLHRMRIAAKKLRYTLELLRPWHGEKFDKYIRASRDIQDVLGDLHELDVLGEVLSCFSKTKDEDFNKTTVAVKRECTLLRADVYRRFVRIWKDSGSAHLWRTLRRTA